jgi:hypothetical protein
MQIVIDIPEEDYNFVKKQVADGITNPLKIRIANGTPLDLEGLKSDMKALNCGFPYALDYLLDCLDKRLGITIPE